MQPPTPHNLDQHQSISILQGRAFTHPETIETKEVLGNPASIVFCNKAFPTKDVMKQIAVFENAPMTAFVLFKEHNVFSIEFYTPSGNEFGLCGHATLIASHFIYEQYGFENVIFEREGLPSALHTTNTKVSGTKEFTQITMPAYMPIAKEIREATEYLSLLSISNNDLVSFYECTQLNDLIIVVNSSEALRDAHPNFEMLATKLAINNIRGLFITSTSALADIDYEVRIFAPHFGIDEDISCGSANCSLLPLWKQIGNAADEKQFKILCPYNIASGKMGGIEIGHFNKETNTINIGGIISE